MKVCTKCGIEKGLGEFTPHKRGKYGYASVCKLCRNAYKRSRHKPVIRGFIGPLRAGCKVCTKCGIEKELGEFTTCKGNKDGYVSVCKLCRNATQRATYTNSYGYNRRGRFIGPLREKYKICGKCRMEKPLESFKFTNGDSYHQSRCMDCCKLNNLTPSSRFSSYKAGAKKRGLPFSLTKEEFAQYWQKPCQYCGDSIDTIGLDRIDSSKGYTMDNVTPCCSVCNRMKRDQSVEEFVSKCSQVVAKMG